MASPVNPPRGMRDFLPAEKARRERVLSVIRQTYRAHGFDEIETPAMEDSERLHAGLGGDNEKLAYAVLKRGLTADELRSATEALDLADLGLRFDLTVPLARFYGTHRAELPTVFRSIQLAPVWRAERPQKGRYRQFMQCDIDIIGEPGALAEVELMLATAAALDAMGIEGYEVRVNDRRYLTALLTRLGFGAAEHNDVLVTLDKHDKVGTEGVIAELEGRGYDQAAIGALREFLDAADQPAPAEVAELCDVVNTALGRTVARFDPLLVRGMGYYTGAIFEVAHPALGYSLGGGGRYDGMIGRFLGTDVPATGFSLGFERLVDLVQLDEQGGAADAVALVHDAVDPAKLAAFKSELIQRGARVRLERRPRNLKLLLEELLAQGFTRFALVTAGTDSVDDLEFKPLIR